MNETTEVKCFLCENNRARVIAKKLRYEIEKEVCACTVCGFVFIKPPFVFEETPEFYAKEYRNFYKAPPADQYFTSQLEMSRERFKRLKHLLSKNMSIAELGSAAGSFLSVMKENGFTQVEGIEPDRVYSQYAREVKDFRVYEESLETFNKPDNSYDAIISFHVLEHTDHPVNFLKKTYALLKEGGVFIAEVPCVEDYLISLLKVQSFKEFYFQPAHNFYFSGKTAVLSFKKAGYKKIQVQYLQRYGLMNGFNWLMKNKPTGLSGQKKLGPILRLLDRFFRALLIVFHKTDTIIIYGYK
jgi:2-polyprenyl-3-methyl-5-hydroxy-6-metoxy-1,4-benzoquinol methylase